MKRDEVNASLDRLEADARRAEDRGMMGPVALTKILADLATVRAALSVPDEEPVAWLVEGFFAGEWRIITPGAWATEAGAEIAAERERRVGHTCRVVPLYRHPTPRVGEQPK